MCKEGFDWKALEDLCRGIAIGLAVGSSGWSLSWQHLGVLHSEECGFCHWQGEDLLQSEGHKRYVSSFRKANPGSFLWKTRKQELDCPLIP